MAAHKTGLDTFDHVVVLMLENRSFDNLLGNLYPKGDPIFKEGKKFEGLQNTDINMPVPDYALDFKQHPTVAPYRATNHHQPFPDPGEVYNHVNTQLYIILIKIISTFQPAQCEITLIFHSRNHQFLL